MYQPHVEILLSVSDLFDTNNLPFVAASQLILNDNLSRGAYRMKEGKMHVHTFDTHSNGDMVMAIGSIDIIEGKASFTVYPES